MMEPLAKLKSTFHQKKHYGNVKHIFNLLIMGRKYFLIYFSLLKMLNDTQIAISNYKADYEIWQYICKIPFYKFQKDISSDTESLADLEHCVNPGFSRRYLA